MSLIVGLPSCLHCTSNETSGRQGRGSAAHPLRSLQQEGVILPNDDFDRHCDALVRKEPAKFMYACSAATPCPSHGSAWAADIHLSPPIQLHSCQEGHKCWCGHRDVSLAKTSVRLDLAIMHIAEHFGHLYTDRCALIIAPSFQLIRCNAAHARKQARRRKENVGMPVLQQGSYSQHAGVPPATWAACFR